MERFERLAAKDFHREAKSHKAKLHQDHRVRQYVDAIQSRAKELVSASSFSLEGRGAWIRSNFPRRIQVEVYDDEDKSLKEEIASMTGDNVFRFVCFPLHVCLLSNLYPVHPSDELDCHAAYSTTA